MSSGMRLPTSWTVRFVGGSLAGAIVLIVLFFAIVGVRQLGLSVNGAIALTLGVVFTVGIGVGLMALVFYSNRSGRDETVGGDHYERRP